MKRAAGPTESVKAYLRLFERAAAARRGEPAFVAKRRSAAIGFFQEHGFPSAREEAWRFTNVAPIARAPFATAEPARSGAAKILVERLRLTKSAGTCLVLVNGRFSPELSRLEHDPGCEIASLAGVLRSAPGRLEPYLAQLVTPDFHAFAALNAAFWEDGLFVRIKRGGGGTGVIHLLCLHLGAASATVSYPRLFITAEAESEAGVLVTLDGAGEGEALLNLAGEIVLGEGSRLELCIEQGAGVPFQVGVVQIRQQQQSRLSVHTCTFSRRRGSRQGGAGGQGLARNDLGVSLEGEGAECFLGGLYLAGGDALVDNHTCVDHGKPHTLSRELYKGILEGKGAGVFDGKIVVRKEAQRTDARQMNKNLLLSKEATVNTKPQLEINADDVKCSHGATIGQMEEDAVFYLRTRGIPEPQARAILMRAFAAEIVEQIRNPAARERIGRSVKEGLPGPRG